MSVLLRRSNFYAGKGLPGNFGAKKIKNRQVPKKIRAKTFSFDERRAISEVVFHGAVDPSAVLPRTPIFAMKNEQIRFMLDTIKDYFAKNSLVHDPERKSLLEALATKLQIVLDKRNQDLENQRRSVKD